MDQGKMGQTERGVENVTHEKIKINRSHRFLCQCSPTDKIKHI
jgi:hypothetical protein